MKYPEKKAVKQKATKKVKADTFVEGGCVERNASFSNIRLFIVTFCGILHILRICMVLTFPEGNE